MEELPHQERLAAWITNAFRSFAADLGNRASVRPDVYAVFDADGRYLTHHPSDPIQSGSKRSAATDAEPFHTAPIAAAIADCSAARKLRIAPVVWPPRHPEARPSVLAAYPVRTDRHDDPIAFLIRISDETDDADPAAAAQMAGLAFGAYLRAHRSESASAELRGKLDAAERTALRNEALFDMAVRLHSRTEADRVMAELTRCLEELASERPFDIYLSQEQYGPIPSVKPLRFGPSEEDMRFRAFTEGKPVVGRRDGRVHAEAVFPLRGKQGVYGVVRLELADGESGDEDLFRSAAILADIAGSAFENARLYEQSNRLVGELRLINEITQRLNQSLKLQDVFLFASTELRHIFDAEFSCILELDRDRDELVVRASEPASFFSEHFASDYGYAGRVVATKEPVIISDYKTDEAVPSVWMEATRSRSLLACPVLVEGDVVGVILVAHRRPHYFTYENYKLLQTLSGHIGLAISNASLHAEVRRMVQTDRLTGLYARHYLDEQIGLLQKKDYCGSLIVVDIDDFKKVNDTHGHQIGDRVLIQVSAIIRSCIREGDTASRWGGEELAVYLPQATGEQALVVAERIRRKVQTETSPKVSVSCGVSDWNWEDDKISVESLFYRADMALYKAKHSGKNRICTG
ncbi:GGDEF domain-containing protein [Paenibacillus flagellatus]|uniref:GGDEF domain-containing protein n=1 Tax=Paenibacillus flagellatus TaxID=2211139 RepID=A0A2V5K974_9BACL|nr:sensor domain-containing diguanylate cyclase [Paenibacillus flagellatus]PYI54413.1 GGDEF domain-containing protein [Paenibacillus flagellatus]